MRQALRWYADFLNKWTVQRKMGKLKYQLLFVPATKKPGTSTNAQKKRKTRFNLHLRNFL